MKCYLRVVPSPSARLSFLYRTRPGIAESSQAGVAAIVTEFGGATIDGQFFGKVVSPDTTVENVTVKRQVRVLDRRHSALLLL